MQLGRFLITAGLLLAACAAAADDSQLLERLRIDYGAMVAAEQDFHRRRQNGSLSGVEAADYAAYVARLHRWVAEDCVALAGAGLPQPPELGCLLQPPPMLAPAAIDQASEQSMDEQLAVLDAELFAGLGEFDEMLLLEQQRVKAAAPMTDAAGGGGGAGGGAGDGGMEEGAEGSEGSESSEGTEDGAGEYGAQPGDGRGASSGNGGGAGPGSQRQQGGQGTPRDIPDGSDDDVVARQLREAAEKETDPELKEKLWEEYRKYKQGTR
ncbi:MAG: hypothetical protein WBN57_05265 [Gammaproteobacteria bacterium]